MLVYIKPYGRLCARFNDNAYYLHLLIVEKNLERG